jgi:hypothetical protein
MSALTPRALGDLLGAPLRALIEAEAIAARTTADFIKDVGFVPPTSTAPTKNGVDDIGSPRLVTFRYQRKTAHGKDVDATISVPLLTIVPIPSLQISEAKIDLSLIVTDATGSSSGSRPQIKAIMATPLVKGQVAQTNKLTMDISITLQQADLTHGMISLMNMLQEGIAEKQKDRPQ